MWDSVSCTLSDTPGAKITDRMPAGQTGTKCGTDFPMVSCCNADQCCETEDPDQADRCSTNVFTRKLRGVSLRSLKGALGFTYTCMCSDPTADSCPDGQVMLCFFASDSLHTAFAPGPSVACALHHKPAVRQLLS